MLVAGAGADSSKCPRRVLCLAVEYLQAKKSYNLLDMLFGTVIAHNPSVVDVYVAAAKVRNAFPVRLCSALCLCAVRCPRFRVAVCHLLPLVASGIPNFPVGGSRMRDSTEPWSSTQTNPS